MGSQAAARPPEEKKSPGALSCSWWAATGCLHLQWYMQGGVGGWSWVEGRQEKGTERLGKITALNMLRPLRSFPIHLRAFPFLASKTITFQVVTSKMEKQTKHDTEHCNYVTPYCQAFQKHGFENADENMFAFSFAMTFDNDGNISNSRTNILAGHAIFSIAWTGTGNLCWKFPMNPGIWIGNKTVEKRRSDILSHSVWFHSGG